MEKELKLAVLIDGDNIPSAYVKKMMEEIAKYGNPTIKRIYGDWTKPTLSKWKKLLLESSAEVFASGKGLAPDRESEIKSLHAKIGEITMENDFLSKALGR